MANLRQIKISTDNPDQPVVFVQTGEDLQEVSDDDLEMMIQSFHDPLSSDQLIEVAELKTAKWVLFARKHNLINIPEVTNGYLQSYWRHYFRIADDLYPALVELVKILTDAHRFEDAIKLSDRTGFVGSNAEAKEYIAKILVQQGDIDRARDILKNNSGAESFINRSLNPEVIEHPQLNMSVDELRDYINGRSEFKNNLGYLSRLYSLEERIYVTILEYFKSGNLTGAMQFAFQHIDPVDEAIVLKWIVRKLVEMQQHAHAELVAKSIIDLFEESNDSDDIDFLHQEYANAMGAIGQFATAFQYYYAQAPEEYLQHLLTWRSAMESIDAGLPLRMMQRILPILSVILPHFVELSEIINKQG